MIIFIAEKTREQIPHSIFPIFDAVMNLFRKVIVLHQVSVVLLMGDRTEIFYNSNYLCSSS